MEKNFNRLKKKIMRRIDQDYYIDRDMYKSKEWIEYSKLSDLMLEKYIKKIRKN